MSMSEDALVLKKHKPYWVTPPGRMIGKTPVRSAMF